MCVNQNGSREESHREDECGTDFTSGAPALSRRQVLTGGSMMAASITAGRSALAQTADPAADREQVRINLTYRALVSREAGKPASIERVRLRPLSGRQVLVRVTANQLCYSDATLAVGGYVLFSGRRTQILGHQGVGVVEAIGPAVRSLSTGDVVFIAVSAHCGTCYNCNKGRADWCSAGSIPAPIIGDLMDGTPVAQEGGGGIGGLCEYTVNYEERLTPVFTSVSHEELSVMTCVGSTGLGTTCTLHPIESGSSVVVFGAGPVGLSAIQGARIQGAGRIIAVEPIPMRREMALKLGATEAVDPNRHGDRLVAYLREQTKAPTDRVFAGGRPAPAERGFSLGTSGPDYVIEAVGRQWQEPKVEQGPDPTGLQVLRQAWELVPPGGWGFTTGVNHHLEDEVRLPAEAFTNGGKTLVSCQNGGIQSRRDLPRFVRLIEERRFDAKSMISNVYRFDDVLKAYQEVIDRTVITNVIQYS